jgi:hypothetical protein
MIFIDRMLIFVNLLQNIYSSIRTSLLSENQQNWTEPISTRTSQLGSGFAIPAVDAVDPGRILRVFKSCWVVKNNHSEMKSDL